MQWIVLLTSGGDALGMNAAIRALTGIETEGRKSIARTDQALGIGREFVGRHETTNLTR